MFLQRENHRIYYEVYGEGDPLLFVHGWMMSSAVWRKQVHHFARNHQVIAFDLTGYGQSDKPRIAYSPDVWMADVDAIVAHCNLDRPTLIGWSMGGSIGMGYALSRPDALRALILVDSTPLLVAPPEVFPYGTPPDAAEQLLGAIRTDFSSGARGFIDLMVTESGADSIRDDLHAITQQTTGPIAMESILSAGDADLRPVLSQISVPTTVLHGEEDMVCKLGAGEHLAGHIPDAGLHTFPGKGHCPFLTDAENFNAILAASLK